ncbi:Uncharacterised protein [Klebsiella michiganensis]|uniref:Uncharacterized protein n=1 Tax=Klebsiella michiganensis TaxID=1134687 RepID=A0A7H4LUR6_9ENTR|nr:Uncharacterised protein [Klebsiella michiganensis]
MTGSPMAISNLSAALGISTAILPTDGKKLLQCELFVLGSFIALAIVIEYIHGMPSFRF